MAPTTVAPVRPTLPPGNGPGLLAVSPASGAAGQQVTLTGRNLFSSSGLIIVRFGSAEAGVSCPVRTTCEVTVPSQPGTGAGKPTSVAVTLTTDSATTNPVIFTYTG